MASEMQQLTFPLLDLQLTALKALVIWLCFRLIVWIVVLGEVWVGQSLRCCDPFVCVQHQHFLQQVHSLNTQQQM